MANEVFNSGGEFQIGKPDTMYPTRKSFVNQKDRDLLYQNDRDWAARARQDVKSDDPAVRSQAKVDIENIRDPSIRMATYAQVFPTDQDKQGTPSALFKDGNSGITDPLSLFFMMVFYLDKSTPEFRWSDILTSASVNSNQNFGNINPDIGFMPQAKVALAPPTPITTTKEGTDKQSYDEKLAAARKRYEEKQAELEKKRNSNKKSTPASNTAKGNNGGIASTVIWPIQNLPLITGGLNKSVEWPFTNQIPTMAEPLLAINNGGSSVEIDVEFTYAVGVPGIGDNASTVSRVNGADIRPEKEELNWTVEEVMGMMYLAESLVFPFQSVPVVGTDVTDEAKKLKEEKGGAQYPVVFLRHYSLFPFLTPFVVKSVKIEPDENQPLIITERNAINNVDTHLSYPAVRQMVKITLSMASAHYYLPVFGNKDDGGQLQKQTSGKTYLTLGATLLKGRV